jgi:phospholipase/carboxylesterase
VSSSAPAGGGPSAGVGQLLRREPAGADRRLVLLHGWGADADDLLELGLALVDPAVSVVALRAPLPHSGGFGRQWYDLTPEPAWAQIPAARRQLRERLRGLAAELPLTRTALLGFSQGAAMAVDAAWGADEGEAPLPLAGLIASSGYPHPARSPRAPQLRVLLTHGRQDPVVPHRASLELEQLLRRAGALVRRIDVPGGHGIDPSLLPAMQGFLEECW